MPDTSKQSRKPPHPMRHVAAVSTVSRDDVVVRVREEYLEMPGLRLKANQVARLCGIESSSCQRALNELVAARFLCVKPDGRYARVADGGFPRPQAAKVARKPSPNEKASNNSMAAKDTQ